VGERLTYTVRVSDSGAKQEPRLKITQTLPTGLRFVSASHGGLVAGNQVSWHAGVSAGGTDSFSLVALVTRLRAGVGQLASVACATVRGSSRPLVCAADLNRLPAATAAAAAAEVRQPAGRSVPVPVLIAVGCPAVLAAGLLVLLARRRSRGRRALRRAG
jgi:uncharacterized repeat protein (TIGR01451 family)